MQRRFKTALSSAALLAAVGLVAAGCTSDDGGTTAGGDGADVEVVYKDADGNCAADPREGVDYAAASALIESFQQQATGLLQSEPLPQPVDPSTTVAFLNNNSAVAGIMQEFITNAAGVAGVNLVNVDTGTDAQSINTALNSVVEMQPDILVSVALDATFFQDQLKQLEDAGTAIVYASAVNADEFGQDDTLGGRNVSLVNGEVLAAAAVNFTCGTGKDFVFYNTPEMAFSSVQLEGAQQRLPELCADCTLRVVDISIMDPSPADKIISDLQANPDTDYFVTPVDQFQIGLAEKANLAGITNAQGMGQSSLPANMEQITNGLQSAGFAVDLNMFMWLLIDEGLRKQQGVFEPYTDWETVGRSVSRILVPTNAAEFLGGFVAYPEMEADFKTLWGR